jgi:betaine-aldehyde dehydrogenase
MLPKISLGCRWLSSAGAGNAAHHLGHFPQYIDGRFASEDGIATAVLSPRDGAEIATITEATVADVDAAVDAARRCFDDESGEWRQLSVENRAKILFQMADTLELHKAEFANLETMDCGKPLAEAEADMDFCIGIMRYYAEIAPVELTAEALAIPDPDIR